MREKTLTNYATLSMDVAFFGFNAYALTVEVLKQSDHLKNVTMVCAVAWNMIDVVGTAVVGCQRDSEHNAAKAVDIFNAVQLFACTVPAMCYLAGLHGISEALATQLAGTSFAAAMLLCLLSDYLGKENKNSFESKDALGMGCATLGMGLIAASSFIANDHSANLFNLVRIGTALAAGLTRVENNLSEGNYPK